MPAICRRANEIRYQYVYHRQKLGIYIYIFVWVYTLNRGGGGGGGGGCHYDDSTACNKFLYDNDNIRDNFAWYISLYMLRIH